MAIHATAHIDPSAQIADDAEIGPGVIIGPNALISSGCELRPYAIIGPNTTLREGVQVFAGAVIGTEPQDLKYDGSSTRCEIGPRTIVREYCTINRGTTASGATIIGADNYLMAYVHIGHDCRIGNHVMMASNVALGGHCVVEDRVVVGGVVGVHQFVRIGTLAMIGGSSGLRQDAPPYMITAGAPPARVYGINAVGLRRNGYTPGTRALIREAFGILYGSGLNSSDALEQIKAELERTPEIEKILAFFETSKRGVARGQLNAHSEEASVEI